MIGMNRFLALAVMMLIATGGCIATEEEALAFEEALAGGQIVPRGQLESVGVLWDGGPICTATLVSPTRAITAAHCVCDAQTPMTCRPRASLKLIDVLRRDDPTTPANEESTRGDVTIAGNVTPHPAFRRVYLLSSDVAVLSLDRDATALAYVTPTAVQGPAPNVGEGHTLVGFGYSNGPSGSCSAGLWTKRRATLDLDRRDVHADLSWTLVYLDSVVHACPGDSGGAAINAGGRLVGVISVATATSTTLQALFAVAPWLARNGVPIYTPPRPPAPEPPTPQPPTCGSGERCCEPIPGGCAMCVPSDRSCP